MQIQIRFINSPQGTEEQEMLEKILINQLDRYQHRLRHVQVYIEDVNGPRGGVDKQCRCVLHPRRMAPIVVRDCDESIPAMIHRVADRAAQALGRKVERRIDARTTQ